jgi:stage II sporulation protein D
MVRPTHQLPIGSQRDPQAGLALFMALCVAAFAVGCQPGAGTSRVPVGRPVVLPEREPVLRVRVIADTTVAAFDSPDGLWIGPPGRSKWQQRRQRFAAPVTIKRQADRFTITAADGSKVTWALRELMIVGTTQPVVRVNATAYPQTLVLYAGGDTGAATRFDVINHVRMESYLPGVLHRELYASWHPTTFRAQAIAARSYALYQSMQRRQERYDLASTTADQVYSGSITSGRASEAVRSTRGQILTDQGQPIPGYYSSCCGGTSQDATVLKGGPDIAPLRGGPRGRWCQASTKYRWGPLERDAATLARRLAAWGRANRHAVADLTSIKDISVGKTNAAARPLRFDVRDTDGRTWSMSAEMFRFACNFTAAGLPKLAPKVQLNSSHVRVAVDAQRVRFTDGRGFGHGVGLCQWGAQGMARQGHSAHQILAHYYPGASIKRAY